MKANSLSGTDDKPDLKFHEVYFNANTGKINGWTERPYQISGYENSKDIVDDLKMILKAVGSNAPLKLKDLEE